MEAAYRIFIQLNVSHETMYEQIRTSGSRRSPMRCNAGLPAQFIELELPYPGYSRQIKSTLYMVSTVNCKLPRARVKVSTSRGEWRWVLVNVSSSIQKGNRVNTFLFFEDTRGAWEMQEAAGCGVSGSEYDCFGMACLKLPITPKYWILPFAPFVGWLYTATINNAARAVRQETGFTGQGHISYCSITVLAKLWTLFRCLCA